jgi:hypothetical protein
MQLFFLNAALLLLLVSAFQRPLKVSRFHRQRIQNDHCTSLGACQDNVAVGRRSLFGSIAAVVPAVYQKAAAAIAETRKPHAPLENLLPAMRVKLLIDDAVDTAEQIVRLHKQGAASLEKPTLISKLKDSLLAPQQFMTKQDAKKAKRYLEIDTMDAWKEKRRKEAVAKFQIEEVDALTRANEAFEQWGERRQFERLRKQQLALERENPMRAAFNAYTNNLVFSEEYTLTASKEEKSRLIRTYDQLPDVTSVVRSDLDLRELYRNQVLTAMDDSKAELQFQLKQDDAMDATELLALLREAQSSCDKWFGFIPEKDVQEALQVVRQEQG